MTSIIIVDNGSSATALQSTIAASQSTGCNQIMAIASHSTLSSMKGIVGFDSSQPIRSSLAAAIDQCSSNMMIIIDSRLSLAAHEMQAIMGEVSRHGSTDYLCITLQRAGNSIGIPSIGSENIIGALSSNCEWPLMCMAINKESLRQIAPLEGESLTEILANLVLKGSIRGQSAQSTRYSIAAPADISLRISGDALARMLRSITAQVNIEDLFPSHSWEDYEEESAAAAYHALAALFVRFGDLEAAADCLKISDKFEDSPRSLALKAMIAQIRGETLGAVANMVASLQSYEMRKHDNTRHYVQFIPGNVEKISDSLQAGLVALNREDNERALECFSQAVFNFDPFFREAGLGDKR
jgi:hypothetical protein